MADYKKMYSILAAAMADSIDSMQKAMQQAEEIYIINNESTEKNDKNADEVI